MAGAASTASEKGAVGENVAYELKGSILTITVDISKQGKASHSGKTDIIASTKGNANIGGVTVGLNVYRKK